MSAFLIAHDLKGVLNAAWNEDGFARPPQQRLPGDPELALPGHQDKRLVLGLVDVARWT
jgi:hypothetical protein